MSRARAWTMPMLILVGVLTTIVAVVAMVREASDVSDALFREAHGGNDQASKDSTPPRFCTTQLHNRAERLRAIEDERKRSQERQKLLTAALVDPTSPHFAIARTELELEQQIARRLDTRRHGLEIDLSAAASAWAFTLGALIATVLAFFVDRTSRSLHPPRESQRGWWTWWLATVAVLMGSVLVSQYVTSTAVDKTWFGFDSYCISATAFWWNKVAFLGNQMIVGCCVALFGCSSSLATLPRITEKQPRLGIGEYVDFVRAWMFRGMLAPLAFGCYWLWLAFANSDRTVVEKVAYSLPVMAVAGLVGVLSWRFVRNMQLLRDAYRDAVAGSEDPPEDPTRAFFEDTPWKLPSVIAGLGAAAWALLDLLGVRDALFGPQ